MTLHGYQSWCISVNELKQHFGLIFTCLSGSLSFLSEALLRKEYKKQEHTFLTPFPWLEDWKLALDSIFIKVQMKTRSKERSRELKGEVRGMHTIFEPHKHCEKPRTVLVEGEPGSGKTVFCQRLATDWAKRRTDDSFPTFRVFLKLVCREIVTPSGELDVKALEASICDQLLPLHAPRVLKRALFEYMKDRRCEALVVLDGLDEMKQKIDLRRLIDERLSPLQCRFLMTSRNDPTLRDHFDSIFQIVGFRLEDAKSYIRKFFEDSKQMGEDLVGKIEEEQVKILQDGEFLQDLASNPLTTSLLCFVWSENGGKLPASRFQLYKELAECVLARHHTKNGRDPPPDLLAHHEEELSLLGCLALKGIEKGELHFDESEFKAEGRTTDVLDFGFLSRERSASKQIKSSRCFQFVHKTLQEFFAALYLCRQLVSGNGEDWLANLARKTAGELRRQYEQVLRFMVCMLSEKGERGKTAASGLFSSLARREARDDAVEFGRFVCELVKECHEVNNTFGDAMVQPVVESWAVSELFLFSRGLSEADPRFRVACSVVKANRPLEVLNLQHNELRDLAALADALRRNRRLVWLALGGNLQLTEETIAALAAKLTHHPAIRRLGLDKKFFGMAALKELERKKPQLGIDFV